LVLNFGVLTLVRERASADLLFPVGADAAAVAVVLLVLVGLAARVAAAR